MKFQEQQISKKARRVAIKVTGFCLVGVVLAYMNEPEPNLYGTSIDELEQIKNEHRRSMQESDNQGQRLSEIINTIEQESDTEKLKVLFQTFKFHYSIVEPLSMELSELVDHVPDAEKPATEWPNCEKIVKNNAQEYAEPNPQIHRYFHILYTKLLLVCRT